jgi:methionyl-tRNA synthetase
MTSDRHLLVTSALPYANGPLHLGHLVEHIQTDIWVRTQRLLGVNCVSICGDDAHGTPIMLKAQQLGITPEELTTRMQHSHVNDFTAFGIQYDMYHTTHSPENQALAELIYTRLRDRGDIIKKTIVQAFDPIEHLFLPDRYVKGTCPRCDLADQYGDNCEGCGATYSPTDLINPVSVLSGATPIHKESEHYFFDLPRYTDFLTTWTQQPGHLQAEMANKLNEWFEAGLKPWDISRDAPYFGFAIPDAPNKYFYVWLDAPIGYMASVKKYCDLHHLSFDDFWAPDSTHELIHFVGKDIVYFHALFWPAMLKGSHHRLPSAIYTHGFLTVNGQKMSKSRGTFITAGDYLDHLNPEYLRYYFAAKLTPNVEDIDLNWQDFFHRINADLIGKVVNIASRCAGFINKQFDHQLASALPEPALYQQLVAAQHEILTTFIARDYARAIRQLMDNATIINQYIDAQKPWTLAKDPTQAATVQAICTQGLNLFRVLMLGLKPVLPAMAHASETFLNCSSLSWDSIQTPLLAHRINPFVPLMQRVEQRDIDAVLSASGS